MLHDGDEVAEVGHSYELEAKTIDSEIYNTGINITLKSTDQQHKLQVMDIPPWMDFTAYTNDELETLMSAAMLDKSMTSIDGILLVMDGLQTRVYLEEQFSILTKIFDNYNQTLLDLLLNTTIVVTKREHPAMKQFDIESIEKMYLNQLTQIVKKYNIDLENIGINPKDRIVFLDTKTNTDKYKQLLINAI